ncbi:hypothetical protein BTF1_02555 [Bacillus thuringiensis HD-789]|uniref:Uncharacterized protein n=2 Tax=Bacillus cereus group TaxID=86661 RepID=B7IJD5_BACC2|nr:hypothetical protein [Bacillus thuringiensis]ACK98366.1 conserved hypothetical protein [Bacillus cereus G9842]AFQ24734.1 hypothetical protein BTF1_02555 [Bacillus thuringiensis HD-789]
MSYTLVLRQYNWRKGRFALIERGENRELWEEADVEDYEERKFYIH